MNSSKVSPPKLVPRFSMRQPSAAIQCGDSSMMTLQQEDQASQTDILLPPLSLQTVLMNKNQKIRKKYPQVFVHADDRYQDLLLERRLLPSLIHDLPTATAASFKPADSNQLLPSRPQTSALESFSYHSRPMSSSRGDFHRRYRPSMLPELVSRSQADAQLTGRSSITDSYGDGELLVAPSNNNQSQDASFAASMEEDDDQSSITGPLDHALEISTPIPSPREHLPSSKTGSRPPLRPRSLHRPPTSTSVNAAYSMFEVYQSAQQPAPSMGLASHSYSDPSTMMIAMDLSLTGNSLLDTSMQPAPRSSASRASSSRQRSSSSSAAAGSKAKPSVPRPTSQALAQRREQAAEKESLMMMEREEVPMVIHSLNTHDNSNLRRELSSRHL
jgi:hypothetical protein